MAKDKRFLIVDLVTGALDGFYNSKPERGMIEYLNDKYPQTNWIITEIVDEGEKKLSLPDSTFHCNALSDYPIPPKFRDAE